MVGAFLVATADLGRIDGEVAVDLALDFAPREISPAIFAGQIRPLGADQLLVALERELAYRLRAQGIKLRDCASFGLPGTVRLGVLPPASQAALERAWNALP